MSVKINRFTCPQNHRCPLIRVCPTGAIEQSGYDLPMINEEKCINCGKCVRYCPLGAVSL